MEIKGKVAIVTGASSDDGIGAECAKILASRGCNVIVNYATNKAGRVPEETIADLWDCKLNYLLRPKKFGGPAMRPNEAFAAGFEISRS